MKDCTSLWQLHEEVQLVRKFFCCCFYFTQEKLPNQIKNHYYKHIIALKFGAIVSVCCWSLKLGLLTFSESIFQVHFIFDVLAIEVNVALLHQCLLLCLGKYCRRIMTGALG